MIEMRDAMRVVMKHRKDDIVLTTETSSRAWADVAGSGPLNLAVPAMSKGSSMALGMALAQPGRRVIVFDGDGCLLMNLGSLVTIADQGPKNFYHIVVDNGMYAMTGGQPVPGDGVFSWAELAEASGYKKSFEFDNLEDWTTGIGNALDEPGPVLVVMKTVPELTDWVTNPPKRKYPRMHQAAPMSRAFLMGERK